MRVLDLPSQVLLSRLAFFVASPALMVTVLADTDVTEVFSPEPRRDAVGVVVAATALRRGGAAAPAAPRDARRTVIGTLCATYVNAGNLGLPIAAYVLGDVALVAPTLLLQLLVLQPIALAVLDHATSTGPVLGAAGALPAVPHPADRRLPDRARAGGDRHRPAAAPCDDPLALVGGMAVPAMLLAYGVSLRLGPRPGHGVRAGELDLDRDRSSCCCSRSRRTSTGRFVLGLDDAALLAVTVLSALPDRAEHLRARDPLRPRRGAGPRHDLRDHRALGAGDPGDHRPAGLIPGLITAGAGRMTGMTELVTYGAAHGVATLTLDSPHNRNALSRQLVAELYELLDRAAADDEAKVVVIRAEGRTFCSGADLSEAAEDGMEKAAGVLVDLQRRIVTFPKPVVTRLHGNVRAGGIGIVAASDIAISADGRDVRLHRGQARPHPGGDLADRAAADDRPLARRSPS